MATSTEETVIKASGFALSSWNYGSFHHCNPTYLKNEYLMGDQKKQERITTENIKTNNSNSVRPQSSNPNPNRAEKRILAEDEKIVTNEYIRVMKDYKTIKDMGNIKRQQSSNKLRSKNMDEHKSQYPDEDSEFLNMSNNSALTESEKKSLKFKLTHDEWLSLKSKQNEIKKKIKSIKDHEDSQLDMYNKRIDKEYTNVKKEVFKDWVNVKNLQKQKILLDQKAKEENKLIEKEKKKIHRDSKMGKWFVDQGVQMETDYRRKKLKLINEKEEKEKKMREDAEKKEQAQEAYRLWCKQKEQEEKSKILANKENSEKIPKKKYYNTGKITIGPYSKSKDLREIHKKLANDQYFSDEFNQRSEEDNKKNSKIEDSLQELSSIKKDTPRSVNENDYD